MKIKKLISGLLSLSCLLGVVGSVPVSAEPSELPEVYITHNFPETVKVGQRFYDDEYQVLIQNLFPRERGTFTSRLSGDGLKYDFSLGGYGGPLFNSANPEGTAVAIWTSVETATVLVPKAITCRVDTRRYLTPDGSLPWEYYDTDKDEWVLYDGLYMEDEFYGEGRFVCIEKQFTFTIQVEDPVIKHNAPSEIKVGSSIDLQTEITNTAFVNEKISDRRNLDYEREHYGAAVAPYYTPSVEVVKGQDLVTQSGQDYTHTLNTSETLTFNKAGTVELRITYRPTFSYDAKSYDKEKEEWKGDFPEVVYSDDDIVEFYLDTGVMEKILTIEVTDDSVIPPESSDTPITSETPTTSDTPATGDSPVTSTTPETSVTTPETVSSDTPATSDTPTTSESPATSTPETSGQTPVTTPETDASEPPTTFGPPATVDPPATSDTPPTGDSTTTAEPPDTTPLPPLVWISDGNTGIKLNAAEGVLPNGTVLVVERSNAELKETNGKYTVFDISLEKGNVKIQPNGKVTVTIPIPEGYDKSNLTIYYIAQDGSTAELASTVKENTISFETDHFSKYAVAEKVAPGFIDSPEGLITLICLGIIVLGCTGAAVCIFLLRKKIYRA